MFEVAELGYEVSAKEYDRRVPVLRERLLEIQAELAQADFPVLIVFAGVDGAGKGDTANLLSEWMDPRRIVTRAYGRPTEEERGRPEFWRFWRDLPPRGYMAVFLKAWYSKPLLQRAYKKVGRAEFEAQLARIVEFEQTLIDDGALILKFWMHLGRKQQKARLRALERDPLTKWRVRPKDWEHWEMYDRFVRAAEVLIARTSVLDAPWRIVEGTDPRHRSLEVGEHILERIRTALGARRTRSAGEPAPLGSNSEPVGGGEDPRAATGPTILSTLDLGKRLDDDAYAERLNELQGRLNRLHRKAKSKGISSVLVFEGMDAAGKGGAIRRLTAALDARNYRVVAVGAPTAEERDYHYLWRFWRLLPRAGRVVIFDRSWYGRVLVERIEGFASSAEWQRAYREINAFERHLAKHRTVLVKCWLHVSDEEQAARFKARAEVPYKRWKLTDEDWRNRARRPAYEQAVHDMVARTSTPEAPWILVEGDDKQYARIRVLEAVCNRLEGALREAAPDKPANGK